MTRRADLITAATDYALDHGLIGLSLRPLAAAVGTSDRMLVYHFGSKDVLLAEIIRHSLNRSLRELRSLPPADSPGAAVRAQWNLWCRPDQQRCERLYVQASTLGLLGSEPYASSIADANDDWMAALSTHLVASGVPVERAEQLAVVIDAAFMGFELDSPLGEVDPPGVAALADAVDALSRQCSVH
ncbi:MAG: TetR/AcrR family transcriptional regulator [Nostocoides sp.]